MPFTSPFGAVMTPSFNPSYSNVPQNKPPKPITAPQVTPPKELSSPETPESSVAELNAGIMPKIFLQRGAQAPGAQRFNAMPMPLTMPEPAQPPTPLAQPPTFPMQPMVIPATAPGQPSFLLVPLFMPQQPTPQQGVTNQQTEEPQLPRRVNPYRPIFV